MASRDGIIGWVLRGTRDPVKLRGITARQALEVVRGHVVGLGQVLHLFVSETRWVKAPHEAVLLVPGVIAGEP